MSDQTQTDAAEAAAAETAAATTTAATTTTAVTEERWDEERAKATIAKQRESEKQLKAQLAEAKKAQDKLAEIEAAQLSEQEKAVKRAEEAEAKAAEATQVLQRAHLLAGLAKPDLAIVDAEAAAALITGIEYDDTGKPTNLQGRVDVLLAERSFLKAAAATTTVKAPNTNAGTGSTGTGAPPNLSPEEVQMAESLGMTPEKYAALKEVRTADDYAKLAAAQAAQ